MPGLIREVVVRRQKPVKSTFKVKKVLIIDDNPQFLFVTGNLIKIAEPGVETLTATSGKTGVQVAIDEHPNAVLLDVLMPDMDGYATCKKLKGNPKTEDIPIVLLSAVEFGNENRLKAIDVGADGFVTKPIDKQELRLQLRAMFKINEGNLRRKSEQQRLEEQVEEQTRGLRAELTRRKKAEEQLQEHEKHLQELNATKDKFFSIIAHDLKTPFGNTLRLSELILTKVAEQNYQDVEMLGKMLKKNADQSLNLLNNLLEWSRTQLGKQSFTPTKLNLGDVINGITAFFSIDAAEKKITLKTNSPGNLIIDADPNMLKTILRNLISNAIKYSFEGGEVIVSARASGSDIVVSVVDQGTGIAPERLKDLFRIDQTVSKPGTNNEKGTGLGLILCKEFVKLHGGKIWAESEPGKGTTFLFTLPSG